MMSIVTFLLLINRFILMIQFLVTLINTIHAITASIVLYNGYINKPTLKWDKRNAIMEFNQSVFRH